MNGENDLGAIVRKFSPDLLRKRGVASYQLKALQAIAKCRTADMGGSALVCRGCGSTHYVLHSCRNRHCPRCQGIDKELWIYDRSRELLPVKYFHVVFTVPHDLLELFRFNRKQMYDLLFEKSWETLRTFASDPKLLGAQLGAISVLHTWDQQIKYHPHVHFIVPAGGIDINGRWKTTKQNGEFLFDVKHMSQVFSARFVKKLRKLKQKGKIRKYVPKNLIKKPWVVYAKQAFDSKETVLEYLARYTHRVAISNARILKVSDTHVTFKWCNRKESYKTEIETITGVEFLKRFIEHIVPPYFRRIRHLGFLSTRNKSLALETIRNYLQVKDTEQPILSRQEILSQKWGEQSLLSCKDCGGELLVFETYERERAPPN